MLRKNKKVVIRNPNSTRPWQHVFEAIGAYMIFAIKLKNNLNLNGEVFNFGPKSLKNLILKSFSSNSSYSLSNSSNAISILSDSDSMK